MWDMELLDAVLESLGYLPLELLPPKLYSAFRVYPRAPTHGGLFGSGGAGVNICITSCTFTSACGIQGHAICQRSYEYVALGQNVCLCPYDDLLQVCECSLRKNI
jgi:hypothetical protein